MKPKCIEATTKINTRQMWAKLASTYSVYSIDLKSKTNSICKDSFKYYYVHSTFFFHRPPPHPSFSTLKQSWFSSTFSLVSPIIHSHLPTHQSAGPTFPLSVILCRHGHCPLLLGITATTKVTSTLSNPQCPKFPFSFRYAVTIPFFYLELGSDYLRKHRSTVFSINIHHWRDLSPHLTPPGPFTSSIPL